MSDIDFAGVTVEPLRLPSAGSGWSWSFFILPFLVLIVLGAGLATIATHSRSRATASRERLLAMEALPPAVGLAPFARVWHSADEASRKGDGPSGLRECTGDEILCTVATSRNPAKMLRVLTAAIPVTGAKSYRVKLSVTPVEESATDESSAASTAQ